MNISKNTTPLVTVAMVTYNQEKFVKTAIESVLCQSYSNLELIIGDDCSNDNTWDIVNSYKDPRIRVYQNEKNLTQYPNRNKALQLSRGEYIIYIDGDDIIYPHGLEFMVRMLHAFPECGMAHMYWFRNNIVYPVVITPYQFFIAEFFNEGFNSTALSNVLFRVSAIKEVGGFPTIHISSDTLLRLYIALKYDSLIINDNITWWRETPGQQSSNVIKSFKGFVENIYQKIEIINHPECPFNEAEKKEAELNIKRLVFKETVKQFLKFNFKNIKVLWPYFNYKLLFVGLKNSKKDPFLGYTPVNPYCMPFKSNPFASDYIR